METLALHVGSDIAPSFVFYARSRTDERIETMRILMGKMNKNGTKIKCKKLILFHQFGDSVRCGLTLVQIAEAMATTDDNECVIWRFVFDLVIDSVDVNCLYELYF